MDSLVLRNEHSRSLEDAERFRAIYTLVELGALTPVSELETYHGRVARTDVPGEWAVDAEFMNGGNSSGNYNVNDRPTLYTGTHQDALEFARHRTLVAGNVEARKLRGGGDAATAEQGEREREAVAHLFRAEVHQVTSSDADAMIIDQYFDSSKLSPKDKERYDKALNGLAIGMTAGSPVAFEHAGDVMKFVEALGNRMVVTESDVQKIAAQAGIGNELALQLASAFNARQFSLFNPQHLTRILRNNQFGIVTSTIKLGSGEVDVPVNVEYIERYMRHAHIVGVRHEIDSFTIDRKMSIVSFFDLQKTATVEQLRADRQAIWQKLGSMVRVFAHTTELRGTESSKRLVSILGDPHSKPEKIVEAAKQVGAFKGVFEADAGNWEGYTLEQHVEAVLRNFDENYADRVPVELVSAMRLIILAHDLGKPEAAKENKRHLQKQYNLKRAGEFLGHLGLDDRTTRLMLAIIGDGEDHALRVARTFGDVRDVALMRDFATKVITEYNGNEMAAEDQVQAFIEMCNMFLVCDGGAYTSMAVVRTGRVALRAAPSFNDTFAEPVGLGRRNLRVRRSANDVSARRNLTPKRITK